MQECVVTATHLLIDSCIVRHECHHYPAIWSIRIACKLESTADFKKNSHTMALIWFFFDHVQEFYDYDTEKAVQAGMRN